jgi:hypothetical protein
LGNVLRELRPLLLWRKTMLAPAERHVAGARGVPGQMEVTLDAGEPILPEHRIMAHFDLAKFSSQQGEDVAPFRIGARGTGSWAGCSRSPAQGAVPFSMPASPSSAARLHKGPRAQSRDSAPVFIGSRLVHRPA